MKRVADVFVILLDAAAAAEEQARCPHTAELAYTAQRHAFVAPSLILHAPHEQELQHNTLFAILQRRIAMAEANLWRPLFQNYDTAIQAHKAEQAIRGILRIEAVEIASDIERQHRALWACKAGQAALAKSSLLSKPSLYPDASHVGCTLG
jgi:hypothetical protein